MSKNRVLIILLAIFLIAGMVSLAGADDKKDARFPPVGEKLKEPTAATPDAVGTSTTWSGYAQIGWTESYVSGTTGYDYVRIDKVYGTTSTTYNGWYRVISSTSVSPSNTGQNVYENCKDCMLHSRWAYVIVNSSGIIYYAEVTPYTVGTL